MKLKKGPMVYFACKGGVNEKNEPVFQVGQWLHTFEDKDLHKRVFPQKYATFAEAEAIASKYNEGLVHACPWHKYEVEEA